MPINSLRNGRVLWLICVDFSEGEKVLPSSKQRLAGFLPFRGKMKRHRVQVFYSGRVQGVGFRYTTKTVAMGYEVTGTVRNLPDGRVEMIAEGDKSELVEFLQGIRDSEVGGFIRQEETSWPEAKNDFRGFEIIR